MSSFTRRLYSFLSACGGNWRNSIYIMCQEQADLPGYLLAADRDGQPVIMSVEKFQHRTGEQIDPAECCGKLTELEFKRVFAQYILWHFPADNSDVLAELSRSITQ